MRQPMYDWRETLCRDFEICYLNNAEIWDVSVDRFRQTGENFSEWSVTEPQTAYHALRAVVIESQYKGDAAAAAKDGLKETYEEPTIVFVRAHRPTMYQSLLGLSPDKARSKEIARFTFGQQADNDEQPL